MKPSSRPLSVLVVDDEPDIRFLLRVVLSKDARFEVSGEAGDGDQAIEAVASSCPDAILLDFMMPKMDGLTALPNIRLRCPESKIVMFSAVSSQTLVEEAMNLGADLFLKKTTKPQAIADALADLHTLREAN
jgi:DNA-binding NarL/FixJ family response regulator